MKRKLSFDEIDQIKSLDQMVLNRNKTPTVCGVGVNKPKYSVGDLVYEGGEYLVKINKVKASQKHDYKYLVELVVSAEYADQFSYWVNERDLKPQANKISLIESEGNKYEQT